MNFLIRKIAYYAITLLLVIIAIVIIFRAWVFYTQSPWTRDAKFSADVVAISPDVTGLITDVLVHDNQLVRKGDALFVVDRPRYQKALDKAQADFKYYQAMMNEKRCKAIHRNQLSIRAISREDIEHTNNDLQTSEYQLAKAIAIRDMALIDLDRTIIKAPSDGWITNLNVYQGEFITRGSVAIALVQQHSFYMQAYMEETKLDGVRPGFRAEITPLGSNIVLRGTVDSIAAGVTNSSSSVDSKGMATIESNLEWVRLAQRVPVRILLDEQPGNHFPAGTTATVVITGAKDRQTKVSPIVQLLNRLREFG